MPDPVLVKEAREQLLRAGCREWAREAAARAERAAGKPYHPDDRPGVVQVIADVLFDALTTNPGGETGRTVTVDDAWMAFEEWRHDVGDEQAFRDAVAMIGRPESEITDPPASPDRETGEGRADVLTGEEVAAHMDAAKRELAPAPVGDPAIKVTITCTSCARPFPPARYCNCRPVPR